MVGLLNTDHRRAMGEFRKAVLTAPAQPFDLTQRLAAVDAALVRIQVFLQTFQLKTRRRPSPPCAWPTAFGALAITGALRPIRRPRRT